MPAINRSSNRGRYRDPAVAVGKVLLYQDECSTFDRVPCVLYFLLEPTHDLIGTNTILIGGGSGGAPLLGHQLPL